MGYSAEIEPLISVELYNAVQDKQQHNRRVCKDKAHRESYLLSGKLFCGLCGSPMTGLCGTGRHGDRHYYYRCVGKQRDICQAKNVRREDIEDRVIEATRRMLFDDAILTHIAACTWDYYRQSQEAGLLDSLRGQLADVRAQLGHLVDALAGGLSSKAVLARVEALEAQEAELLDGIKAEERREAAAPTQDFILAALRKYRDTDFGDRTAVAALIRVFVNAVYVWPDRLVIGYNYRDGEETISLSAVEDATGGGSSAARDGVPWRAQANPVFLSGVVLLCIEKESVV